MLARLFPPAGKENTQTGIAINLIKSKACEANVSIAQKYMLWICMRAGVQ